VAGKAGGAMKVLTAIAIANLKPRSTRYEVGDGGCRGLKLCIFPSGARSFVLRYRYKGTQKKLTLGPYLAEEAEEEPVIGAPLNLASARMFAANAMHQVKRGIDPAAEKRRKRDDFRREIARKKDFGAPAPPAKVRRRPSEREREYSRERRRREALAYRALKKLGLDHLLTTETTK
jgi:Arm DNA-binding domain